ncbi:hypothetical protein FBEOM_13931 [Fusarium beomiforme]|uniref:F-box domain-containing protein n=1 Tax=Fusarium beomiforme TaxID=44412 RepID=A0A9P5A5G3_9HYPO|nr:hypothetical protein FBEOM_13931 [Fusarium beomiforme]
MAYLSIPRLPSEVLHLIFGHFCLHCQDAYSESCDERPLRPAKSHSEKQKKDAKPWYSITRQTLCSLSLACRQFRDVAQSVLHHEFVLGCGDSWRSQVYTWESRLAPFVRTLARQPYLAYLVKVVYINGRIFDFSQDGEQPHRAILIEAAGALGVDLSTAWKERIPMISDGEAHDWPDVYPIFIDSYLDNDCTLTEEQERQLQSAMSRGLMPGRRWMNGELVAMLLAQVPNVHHISIEGGRGWPTYGLPVSTFPALGITQLPAKTLDLCTMACPLVQLSTHLETLNLHQIQALAVSAVEMPCLKTLRVISGVLTAESLSSLLRACTGGLVAFECKAEIEDRFMPSVCFLCVTITFVRC